MTTTSSTSPWRVGALALTAGVTLLAGACGNGNDDEPPGEGPVAVADAFTPELQDLCNKVTSRTVAAASGPNMVIVQDGTQSVVGTPSPDAYVAQISQLSEDDGGLTLIGVNGADTKPSTLLLDAALSTPGPRDRPSVAKLADLMPTCVDQGFRTSFTSTGTGTDLYRAMATAAEVATAQTQLWTFTDMLSNAGQLALTAELLAQEPDVAGRRAAAAAPLDLHGAMWHVVGIANTTAGLMPADRSWLLAFTQELCRSWHAAGCDAIALAPTKATTSARPAAPSDAAPTFPTVSTTTTATTCTFSVPSSVGFRSDSSVLLPGAESLLSGALDLLSAHPDARAVVVGHTASTDPGSEGHSGQQLSLDRAEAVAAVLERVAPGRVKAKGVGDSEPLGEDLDPTTGEQVDAAAARERRVDITVTGTGCA